MKKLLLFLALFGSGLALLLFLSSRMKQQKKERLPQSSGETVVDENLPFTRIPDVPREPSQDGGAETGGDEPSSMAAVLDGYAYFDVLEEGHGGRKLYDIDIAKVTHLGDDVYDLEGITAHTYDPELDPGPDADMPWNLEATLVATSGRAHIEWRGGKFAVGRAEPIELFDALVTLHRGTPMAPLVLTMPSVRGDLERDRFTSDEAVELVGNGITASSLGLVADQRLETLELLRDGHAHLVTEDGREVELLASGLGPMLIRRTAIVGDVESLELTVTEGARAIVHGDDEFTLDSRDLILRGATRNVMREGVIERAFVPDELLATEEVLAHHVGGELTGGRATAEFDELGELEKLTVFEQPTLGGELTAEVERGAEPEQLWLELAGVGPLVLDYTKGEGLADFVMPGPATIQARGTDLWLEADERIDGRFHEDGRADIFLRGAVHGRLHGMDFVGSNVRLVGREDEPGHRQLFVETDERAHLEGIDEAGRPVQLDTRGELRALIDRAQVFVPLAHDAHLEIIDEGLWTLDVGELIDLDLERGTFKARGGVVAGGRYGVTHAERAVGHSRTHLELFGKAAGEDSEAVPVRHDLAAGEVEGLDSGLLRATRVVLRDDYARVDDSVELRFRGDEGEQSLDCGWAEVRFEGDPEQQALTPFEFEARDVERAVMRDADGETIITARFVTGRGVVHRSESGEQWTELQELVGHGGVTATFAGSNVFTGTGERFTWSPTAGGHLEARPGKRVEARGRLEPGGTPYILTATWIEYSEGRMEALAAKIVQDKEALATDVLAAALEGGEGITLRAARADWMAADDFGLLMSGDAHFSGFTRNKGRLELVASSIHVDHQAGTSTSVQNFERLVAWDGFVLRVEEQLVGRGEILEVGYETLRMEGRPAQLEAQGFVWQAYNLVYDVPRVLVTTDQGRLIGAEGSEWEGWTADYESLEPFVFGDTTIMVMRQPVFRRETEEMRANWALLWVDRDEWVDRTAHWLGRAQGEEFEPPPREDPVAQDEQAEEVGGETTTLFGSFNSRELSKIVKEVYLEGDVEFLQDGNRTAKLGAAYIDMVDGHGWFSDCELWLHTSMRGVPTRFAVRSAWMRHSADGTLSADEAQITACDFADPDYFIRTRNLRMKPAVDSAAVWDVELRGNSLVLDNGLSMPLPRVHYQSDGRGIPTLGGFSFGDSARFGTFVEASMNLAMGEGVSKAVASMVGTDPEDVHANMGLHASYYNLRGPLLGTGIGISAGDEFWMNLYLDGVYDTGKDVGIVRSKQADSDQFRWVVHSRARYLLSKSEWVDFQFASQSDAGVQSEFYESDFIHYDKRDTFLRWRKADDANYYSAIARIRTDSFRNDVERLPDLGALHGRTPITMVAGVPLLYTGSVDAAYLRRRESNSPVVSPFDPIFKDGLGDRDYLRADTRQRVEAPFDTKVAGVRVTPYSSFVATAWSEGADPSTSPSRASLIVGAEAQATYFRVWNHGVINDITPLIGLRADLGSYESDGTPIRVDPMDAPLEGRFLDLGLRSRWRVPGSNRKLDIAAKISHGSDVAEGVEEGWQPVSVLAEFLAVFQGVPFGIKHDARYDLDDNRTTLSYTSFSFLPWDTLGFGFAYHHGLDDQRDVLYDAMSFGATWDASAKWQIEGRQTISRIDGANLDSSMLVRRLGHDFIFEVTYGFRAGEGRSSVGFGIRPRLGWRRPGLGLVDTLKSMRL